MTPDGFRWIFFARDMLAPISVKAGTLAQVDERGCEALDASRETAPADAFFDLTPGPVKDAFARVFGVPLFDKPASTACLYPCPWCMAVNKATGQLRPLKSLTKCTACDDTRSVIIIGNFPGAASLIQPPKET